MRFSRVALTFVLILSVGCSVEDVQHKTVDSAPENLEYPASVSEVAWEWRPPGGSGLLFVRPVPTGALIFHGDGVVALAGDSGEEVWKYRVKGSKIVGDVSDSREYVSLHVSDEGEGKIEMVVLDSGTGEIVHQYSIDHETLAASGDGVIWDQIRPSLSAVTEEAWFTSTDTGGGVTARELGTDEILWSVEAPLECEETRTVDSVFAWDETVLLALTCFVNSDSPGHGSMDDQIEFVSSLIALDTDDGSELWREEGLFGRHPDDSILRDFTTFENGLVLVRYPYSDTGKVLDVSTGEVVTMQDRRIPVWASDDGSRIGVWDRYVENYWIIDLEGETQNQLSGRSAPVHESTLSDPGLGLEQGVFHADSDLLESGEVARFDGFESSFSLHRDRSVVHPLVRLVPGAVVLTYLAEGDERYAIGLK